MYAGNLEIVQNEYEIGGYRTSVRTVLSGRYQPKPLLPLVGGVVHSGGASADDPGRTTTFMTGPMTGERASRSYVAGDVAHGYRRDARLAGRSRHRDFCISPKKKCQGSVIAFGPIAQ